MLGKKRVLRKNLSEMAMMNVPMKRRHENMNTSAVYVGVSHPLPNRTPFNSLHAGLFSADQSTTLSASVLFPVPPSETTPNSTLTTTDIHKIARMIIQQFTEVYNIR